MSNNRPSGRLLPAVALGAVAAILAVSLGCGGNSSVQPTATPTPISAAPAVQGTYTLTLNATKVAPGAEMTVSWTAAPAGRSDWISLYRVTATNLAHGWAASTEGAASGTFALFAPAEPGQYEFRYLLNDGYVDVARSVVVTVDSPR